MKMAFSQNRIRLMLLDLYPRLQVSGMSEVLYVCVVITGDSFLNSLK